MNDLMAARKAGIQRSQQEYGAPVNVWKRKDGSYALRMRYDGDMPDAELVETVDENSKLSPIYMLDMEDMQVATPKKGFNFQYMKIPPPRVWKAGSREYLILESMPSGDTYRLMNVKSRMCTIVSKRRVDAGDEADDDDELAKAEWDPLIGSHPATPAEVRTSMGIDQFLTKNEVDFGGALTEEMIRKAADTMRRYNMVPVPDPSKANGTCTLEYYRKGCKRQVFRLDVWDDNPPKYGLNLVTLRIDLD